MRSIENENFGSLGPLETQKETRKSPKPLHLKPGHLKMAFQLTVPSRWRLPCGIPLEREVRIDVSSANCRAKCHFQLRTSVRNPIFRCPPLRFPSPFRVSRRPKIGEKVNRGVSQRGVPNFFGKDLDCVADPFGTVPCRCCYWTETEDKDKPENSQTNRQSPEKIGRVPKSYFGRSPETFVDFFFKFALEFRIEKRQGFLVILFLVSVSHARLKNSGKIRSKFGAKFGTRIQKLGELSFCNFSDLTKRTKEGTNRDGRAQIRKPSRLKPPV